MQILLQSRERKPILAAEYTAARKPRHAQPPVPWAVGDRVLHTERRRGGFCRKLRGVIVKLGKVNITIEFDLLGKDGQVRATERKSVNPGTLARVIEPAPAPLGELEFLGEALTQLRSGQRQPMARLTAAQLEAIEEERPGHELCTSGRW